MEEILISQEQAKQLAQAFIADIDSYVEQHRSEFEAFLKSEGYPESEVDMEPAQKRTNHIMLY